MKIFHINSFFIFDEHLLLMSFFIKCSVFTWCLVVVVSSFPFLLLTIFQKSLLVFWCWCCCCAVVVSAILLCAIEHCTTLCWWCECVSKPDQYEDHIISRRIRRRKKIKTVLQNNKFLHCFSASSSSRVNKYYQHFHHFTCCCVR